MDSNQSALVEHSKKSGVEIQCWPRKQSTTYIVNI